MVNFEMNCGVLKGMMVVVGVVDWDPYYLLQYPGGRMQLCTVQFGEGREGGGGGTQTPTLVLEHPSPLTVVTPIVTPLPPIPTSPLHPIIAQRKDPQFCHLVSKVH